MEITKGEWKVRGNLVEVFGRGIVSICPSPQADGVLEFIANAQLISSAPDLYEALRELNRCYESPSTSVRVDEAWIMAKQALAKAEK